jgi:hypothetical protein
VKRACIALALVLAGCGGDGIRVESVPVPTASRCIDPAKIPVEPPLVDDLLTGNADADVNTIAASAKLLRAWGKQLNAIVAECAR